MADKLKRVFPYFGGKKRVAPIVWDRFRNIDSYLEPFGGSLAVALECPFGLKSETLNDRDGFICNFWRSVASDPESVARFADWPVSHLDLTARHTWLRNQRENLQLKLAADPTFYNPEIAGVWVWGISAWIGGRWCGYKSAKRPDVYGKGHGVHSVGQRPTLRGEGCNAIGQRPHFDLRGGFYDLYQQLCERLRYSRITCCDWKSLKSCVNAHGKWGVFLDPPYTRESGRRTDIYATDDLECGKEVAAWARDLAQNPKVVVILCGVAGEYEMPGFEVVEWESSGYARGGRDRREVMWIHGHGTAQQKLFDADLATH